MPKFRFLAAVLFVGASITTAYFFKQVGNGPVSGVSTFSSQEDLIEQVRDLVEKGREVQREISEVGRPGEQEAAKCQCALAALDSPHFQFENWEECGIGRSYFREDLEKLPPVFREHRARAPADFPRICMTFMMKRQFPKSDLEPKSYFAKCEKPEGTPERGNYKPCVTETYVNTVYNIYSDVTSCFGVPQKDLLPKILTESGFHMNALGMGFDAGVAQLTGPAIDHANYQFKKFQDRAASSEKESCRRIKSSIQKLKPLPVSKEIGVTNRCGLISPPENPLKNLFYMAIKYNQDQTAIEYYKKKYDIQALMKYAGMKKYESESLNQILISLSFNAGAHSAVLFLKNYLEMKISKIKQKKAQPIKIEDFNFAADMSEFKGKTAEDFKLGDLTFPGYLMFYQNSGAKGYLSQVMVYARILNAAFKEGTCVPEAYLSLSQ